MEINENGYYYLDIDEDQWKEIRRLAENAMNDNLFDRDPVKCVINSYITLLMIDQQLEESNDQIH